MLTPGGGREIFLFSVLNKVGMSCILCTSFPVADKTDESGANPELLRNCVAFTPSQISAAACAGQKFRYCKCA